MAKFYGVIGYAETVETRPSIWQETVIERPYYGDIVRNARRLEGGDSVNDDITPTKHRHSFSASQTIANGHTHKVKIDGTYYTSLGVSTNSSHSVSISGNTGYYPS